MMVFEYEITALEPALKLGQSLFFLASAETIISGKTTSEFFIDTLVHMPKLLKTQLFSRPQGRKPPIISHIFPLQ